ncbi:hypothetical protein IPQ72_06095 [Xanthomonas perforans]|nr:hypothetical protein [Xanthomonas perforans]
MIFLFWVYMVRLSRHIRFTGVVVALLTLSSCSQENAPQSHSAVSDAVIAGQDLSKTQVLTEVSSEEKKSSVESVEIAKLSTEFKEGMSYGDLRKKVIGGNWKPVVSAECKKNVVGDDFEGVCSKDPKRCAICDELPELNICSGDGHCITEFSSVDGRQVLKVSTYGEIQDGLVEGDKSRLFVSWWDVSTKAD